MHWPFTSLFSICIRRCVMFWSNYMLTHLSVLHNDFISIHLLLPPFLYLSYKHGQNFLLSIQRCYFGICMDSCTSSSWIYTKAHPYGDLFIWSFTSRIIISYTMGRLILSRLGHKTLYKSDGYQLLHFESHLSSDIGTMRRIVDKYWRSHNVY